MRGWIPTHTFRTGFVATGASGLVESGMKGTVACFSFLCECET